MYEELIKRLRLQADVEKFYSGEPMLYDQAADAIEELSDYVRKIEELRKDGYYLQKTKMMTYGRATMTMPLPEPPKGET